MAADGSVFLIGIGEEEAFDFDSVVVHLNSSGSFMWNWKVSGMDCPHFRVWLALKSLVGGLLLFSANL